MLVVLGVVMVYFLLSMSMSMKASQKSMELEGNLAMVLDALKAQARARYLMVNYIISAVLLTASVYLYLCY